MLRDAIGVLRGWSSDDDGIRSTIGLNRAAPVQAFPLSRRVGSFPRLALACLPLVFDFTYIVLGLPYVIRTVFRAQADPTTDGRSGAALLHRRPGLLLVGPITSPAR